MADELDSFIPFLSVLKLFLLYRKEPEKAFDCFTHVVSPLSVRLLPARPIIPIPYSASHARFLI